MDTFVVRFKGEIIFGANTSKFCFLSTSTSILFHILDISFLVTWEWVLFVVGLVIAVVAANTSSDFHVLVCNIEVLGTETNYLNLSCAGSLFQRWIIFLHNKAVLELLACKSLVVNPHKASVVRKYK